MLKYAEIRDAQFNHQTRAHLLENAEAVYLESRFKTYRVQLNGVVFVFPTVAFGRQSAEWLAVDDEMKQQSSRWTLGDPSPDGRWGTCYVRSFDGAAHDPFPMPFEAADKKHGWVRGSSQNRQRTLVIIHPPTPFCPPRRTEYNLQQFSDRTLQLLAMCLNVGATLNVLFDGEMGFSEVSFEFKG